MQPAVILYLIQQHHLPLQASVLASFNYYIYIYQWISTLSHRRTFHTAFKTFRMAAALSKSFCLGYYFLLLCLIGFISHPAKAAVKKYLFDVSIFYLFIYEKCLKINTSVLHAFSFLWKFHTSLMFFFSIFSRFKWKMLAGCVMPSRLSQ